MENPKLIDHAGLRLKGLKHHNSTLLRLEKKAEFPKRVKVGAKTYWLAEEIDAFITNLKAER